MSEGNRYGVSATILRQLVQSHAEDTQTQPPHASYNQGNDTLEIVFKDCSYFEDSLPEEQIVVLRAMHGEPIAVGVRIHNWSQVKIVQRTPGMF